MPNEENVEKNISKKIMSTKIEAENILIKFMNNLIKMNFMRA